MLILCASLIVLFLAFANGANDNFKGVATLFGSGTATYRNSLIWATFTTALGALATLYLASGLVAAFSGKGIVPAAVASTQSYSLAVVLAAAITVMLATRLGFPISTTHALTGGLVGAGLFASPTGVDWSKLGTTFFAPLLLSPVLATMLAMTVYPIIQFIRSKTGVSRESCVCVGSQTLVAEPAGSGMEPSLAMYSTQLELFTSENGKADCASRSENFVGTEAGPALDRLHYLSAGIVCFARALNDTPKIAAILLVGSTVSPGFGISMVAAFMLIGGLLNSKKIADTMAIKVTTMNPGQGLTANLITGTLVITASKFGLPVSTTHVACGSIFGIGTVTRQANWKTISGILVAWITTLPISAALSAGLFLILRHMV